MATSVSGNNGYSKVTGTSVTPNNVSSVLKNLSKNARRTVTTTASALTLTNPDLVEALSPHGLLVSNGGGGGLSLNVADTAASAATLQSFFGLSAVNDRALLKFVFLVSIGTAESLLTGAGTSTNVQVKLFGGAAAATAVAKSTSVKTAGTVADALVEVVATNVTSGAEVVEFNIVQQCT
jgi:hypothetical protein